jgi:hypothetical protein
MKVRIVDLDRKKLVVCNLASAQIEYGAKTPSDPAPVNKAYFNGPLCSRQDLNAGADVDNSQAFLQDFNYQIGGTPSGTKIGAHFLWFYDTKQQTVRVCAMGDGFVQPACKDMTIS